jgi:hypothetical protein
MCHDYQPGGRELRFVTTVAEQKRANMQLREGTTKQEYANIRKTRDAQLDMPALILPAIQINIRAGEFPMPEANGTTYLKIPLNLFLSEHWPVRKLALIFEHEPSQSGFARGQA